MKESERIHLPKLIAEEFGLSRSEVRRLVQQGAVRLDGEPTREMDPTASQLAYKLLSVGKKRSVQL